MIAVDICIFFNSKNILNEKKNKKLKNKGNNLWINKNEIFMDNL